jgi:hypothetical protein
MNERRQVRLRVENMGSNGRYLWAYLDDGGNLRSIVFDLMNHVHLNLFTDYAAHVSRHSVGDEDQTRATGRVCVALKGFNDMLVARRDSSKLRTRRPISDGS